MQAHDACPPPCFHCGRRWASPCNVVRFLAVSAWREELHEVRDVVAELKWTDNTSLGCTGRIESSG